MIVFWHWGPSQVYQEEEHPLFTIIKVKKQFHFRIIHSGAWSRGRRPQQNSLYMCPVYAVAKYSNHAQSKEPEKKSRNLILVLTSLLSTTVYTENVFLCMEHFIMWHQLYSPGFPFPFCQYIYIVCAAASPPFLSAVISVPVHSLLSPPPPL